MLIRNFSLHTVELTEPVLENAFMKEQEYLRKLQCGRLLAGFRQVAGMDKKAETYPGGWEDAELAGHTLGHYMTALAQLYAATGAKDIKERLSYIVQELSACQQENGYLFASPEEIFDRVERGEPAWVPWYTMHKVLSGLLSVYQLAKLKPAFEVALKLGMWVYNRTATWTDEVREQVLMVEYGGMNDCMYELYKETGKKEFLRAAEKFDETELFHQIAEGKDVLAGKHANTTIPKFIGALNRYFALGESEAFYLRAARSFFDIVTENHTYVTGGNSEWEHFKTAGTLGKERTQCNCETCNTYNMLKLAEGLYFVTGDKRYMDFYERAYMNAILGSQNPETGMTTYFQPMAAGYFKTFSTPEDNFWCCTGTGMENFTKLNSAIYHTGENRLYVNLYVSSVLTDGNLRMKLTQRTDFNHFDKVSFTISAETPKRFALCLRLPDWAEQRFEVKLNGETADYALQKGYLILEKEWGNNEQVTLRFFPEIKLHPLPDAPYGVAATYGPFVLAAGLGSKDMETEKTGVNVTIPSKNPAVRDTILIRDISVREWFANSSKNFVKADNEVAFYLQGTDADGELLFTPYYKHYKNRYGIYFNYFAEEGMSDNELRELTRRQEAVAEEAAKDMEKQALKQAKKEQKQKEKQNRKEQKQSAKWEEEDELERESKSIGRVFRILVMHLVFFLIGAVLLYAFEKPLQKAKVKVDKYVAAELPAVAKLLGVTGEEDVPAFGEHVAGKQYYLADPEAYAMTCSLASGFHASVAELEGKEYIRIEGQGLTMYYPNEISEDKSQYVVLEKGVVKSVQFWNYDFEKPESLCPAVGKFNGDGIKQYAFFNRGDKDKLHVLDAETLQEYPIASTVMNLALMADVVAYTESGNELHIDTVIQNESYLFAVPKNAGEFNPADYTINARQGFVYTLEEDGLRFDTYVVAAGKYLGKVVGKMALSGQAYVLKNMDFYAYAEEDYADIGGDSIIHGVTLEEAECERIQITGDLGEKLLIPVRQEIPQNEYMEEGFVKNEKGEYSYEVDGKTVSIKGIDVSKYQDNIDWAKVKASGVEYAIIRLGFRGMGTEGTCELDPFFKQNVEGALAAGIEVGVYFFTQAVTVEEAKEEAAFVIENLKGYDITWPVAFDTEEITSYKAARANKLSRETRTACAKAFMDEIAAAGYTPMLYANTRWTVLKLDMSQLADYDLWYAYYGDSIYYPYHFTMWQYSASGKVDGVKTDTDMNISFVDYGAK